LKRSANAESKGQFLRNILSLNHLGQAAILALLFAAPVAAKAQDSALPDSPGSEAQHAPQLPGSISGTITDSDGDAIAGATVTLSGDAIAPPRTIIADHDGYFSFLGVPAGSVKLTFSSEGFATVVKPLSLHSAEELETPDIKLPVATATTDVEAVSQYEAAELDMKTEEKQRLIGFVPNFYVTYNWHAPPMTAGQKFRMSFRTIIDPANFAIAGIIAGIEQSANAFPGYNQGATGFGKRYGASLADGTVGAILGGAVFPALLHQDPRYFYKGTGSVSSRVLYALAAAFICRGDNGKWQPNYSSVLGDIATGAVSNTYYPASNRNGAAETIEIGLINAAEDGFSNILEEFVFKHISTGVSKKQSQP
jgi:hypothetical protein